MMASVSYPRGSRVAIEWQGLLGAAVGTVLAIWRGAAVTEEKVSELRRRLDERERLDREFQTALSLQLQQTFEKIGGLVTKAEVTAIQFADYSREATRAMENISKRLEAQTALLIQHSQDIAVLKKLSGGGQ